MESKKYTKGFGLIEALVAVGIIGAIVVGSLGSFQLFLAIGLSSAQSTKAIYLMEEGVEVVRSTRDNGWDTDIVGLSTGTAYYPTYASGAWTLSGTQTFVDGTFDRTVTLGAVDRDTDGLIVTSGGANDPNTREVVVSVSWLRRGATTTRSVTTYITNYLE